MNRKRARYIREDRIPRRIRKRAHRALRRNRRPDMAVDLNDRRWLDQAAVEFIERFESQRGRSIAPTGTTTTLTITGNPEEPRI